VHTVCCRRKKCTDEIIEVAGVALKYVATFEKRLKGLIKKFGDVTQELEQSPTVPLELIEEAAKEVGEASMKATRDAIQKLNNVI
jgi:predicted butyrate kinase (DUF1464 family)